MLQMAMGESVDLLVCLQQGVVFISFWGGLLVLCV